MQLTVDWQQGSDGRWLARVLELPGVSVAGTSREDAVAKVQAAALRVLADRLELGILPAWPTITFVAVA